MFNCENKVFCIDCKWHKRDGDSGVWFDQVCKAPPQNPDTIDFVLKKKVKGNEIYCSSRNRDGNCTLYEKADRWCLSDKARGLFRWD